MMTSVKIDVLIWEGFKLEPSSLLLSYSWVTDPYRNLGRKE